MRFERLHRAERIMLKSNFAKCGECRMYGAKMGKYQFVVLCDGFEQPPRWTASYRCAGVHNSQNYRLNGAGCLDPTGDAWFVSQVDAENACRKAWKLLRDEPDAGRA
jgi:hypothetical protein